MGPGKIPLTSSECASSWMRYMQCARAWPRQKGLSLHEPESPSASAAMLMPVARRLSGMKRDLDGQLERPTSAIGKGGRHREACRHQFGVVHGMSGVSRGRSHPSRSTFFSHKRRQITPSCRLTNSMPSPRNSCSALTNLVLGVPPAREELVGRLDCAMDDAHRVSGLARSADLVV